MKISNQVTALFFAQTYVICVYAVPFLVSFSERGLFPSFLNFDELHSSQFADTSKAILEATASNIKETSSFAANEVENISPEGFKSIPKKETNKVPFELEKESKPPFALEKKLALPHEEKPFGHAKELNKKKEVSPGLKKEPVLPLGKEEKKPLSLEVEKEVNKKNDFPFGDELILPFGLENGLE